MSSHTIAPILLENAAVLKSWTLDTQSPITYNHNVNIPILVPPESGDNYGFLAIN